MLFGLGLQHTSCQVFKCSLPVAQEWLQASKLEWLLSGSIALWTEIPVVPKECVLLRSSRVGRNVNANTHPKTQCVIFIYSVVPKQNRFSNEETGHHPAAVYYAKHSSGWNMWHSQLPAYYFSFASMSLELTECIYSIACKHTLSENPQLLTVIIIIIKEAETCFTKTHIFISGSVRD